MTAEVQTSLKRSSRFKWKLPPILAIIALISTDLAQGKPPHDLIFD